MFLNYTSYECEHCPYEEYYNKVFGRCTGCKIKEG